MKNFKLNKIVYKNIMSVGAKPIAIQLDNKKMNLISGFNGAGKSTLIEAITFCIFGKPFRDIKKGQLLNTYNKKGLEVELWVESNGSNFYIKRGQKPNIFEVQKDGVSVDFQSGASQAQDEFEEMIGFNYSTFKQIVVLGTAGYIPFMNLKTPERRRMVEDLLSVTVLAEMDKLNKAEIREINQNISILDERIDSISGQLKIYKESQERQDKMSSGQLERLENMKSDIVIEIDNNTNQMVELEKELSELVEPEIPPNDMGRLRNNLAKIDAAESNYKKVIELYGKGGNCPSCMQVLSAGDSPIVSKLHKKVEGTIDLRKDVNSSIEELDKLLTEYENFSRQDRELRNRIQGLKGIISGSNDKLVKINTAIDKCKEERIDYSAEIQESTNLKEDVVNKKSDLIMEKYQRSTITEMLKDSGIKGSIVNDYIPIFNKEINRYLKIMEADYVFTLDKEFNETIKSRGREEFSYNSFSQGEKARIDLALLFTWRSIAETISGIKLSFLVLDEVTDGSTDEMGIKAIKSILNSLEDTNIYVISHRGHNPDDYDRHIKMNKIGRFSVMESN